MIELRMCTFNECGKNSVRDNHKQQSSRQIVLKLPFLSRVFERAYENRNRVALIIIQNVI